MGTDARSVMLLWILSLNDGTRKFIDCPMRYFHNVIEARLLLEWFSDSYDEVSLTFHMTLFYL